jgi:lambda repressor-like predicted transcriptional regulator/mannose-6-phosphate isomerase-like protein (cupin superfamily)
MSDSVPEILNLPAKPGAMVRAVREQRGWTLAEVSERTGLSVSTLSKVENDKMSLTYDKLSRISKGLGIDIGQLFAAGTAPSEAVPARTLAFSGRRSLSRSGEGSVIDTPNYGHVYSATELLNKQMVPIFGQPKARTLAEFGELLRHSGEEFSVVLEGAVMFHTELYAPVLLQTGDSVYFDSSMGHAYLRVGDGPCRVLTVCSDGPSLAAAGYPPTMDEPQIVRAPASEDSVAPAPAKPPPRPKSRKR